MSSSKTVSKTTPAELNPRTTSYEFLGPPGALFVTFATPLITYALYFGCSELSGGCPPKLALASIPDHISLALSDPAWWKGLWDTQAALIYLGWYAFCVVAWAVLPGDYVEGAPLRTGEKKMYKINGRPALCIYLRYALTRLSILNIPTRPGHHFWNHLSLWPRELHILLRQMDWLCYGCAPDVYRPSPRMLPRVLQGRKASRSWGKLGKYHL